MKYSNWSKFHLKMILKKFLLGETLPICSINSTSQKGFHNERDNELEAKKNNFEVDCPSNRDVENNYSMTVFQKSTDFSNIIEENKNEEKCIEYFENHTEPVLVFEGSSSLKPWGIVNI